MTQGVQWETDLNIASARAEREQRPLFLHFVGNDSPAARQMELEVFTQPSIAAQLNANFVMVKINASENPALAQRFSITSIPTDLIIRPNGQVINNRVGVIPADRFGEYLAFLQKMIQSDRGAPTAPAAAPASNPPQQVSNPHLTNQHPPQQHPQQQNMPQQNFVASPPMAPQREMVPSQVPAPHGPPPSNFADPFAQQPPLQQPNQPQSQAVAHVFPTEPMNSFSHSHPGNNPPRSIEATPRPAMRQNQAIAADVAASAKATVEVPLGLEGFCPVTLSIEERWITGNPAYCAMYQGHLFRFASLEALTTFARNPANYIPVAMGEDIVLKVERNQRVNGDRKFGACFQGRIFLFASQETLNAFAERPDYYMEIGLRYETARREQPTPIVY
ncbi:MAG: thioredoxin family protein [Planctomycetaceae bacterium]|nr:thioredoxin family protein [Planctomycetaceae bacterium]